MKRLFFFCLATLVTAGLGACSKTASMNAPSGGVDGGGGGTLPAKPIGDYEFREVIETAKRDLGLFVKYSQLSHARYRTSTSDLEKKLYNGPKTIWDVLQSTDLEIRSDRACQDAYGNDRDASIHASRPDTICLSSFRINPKTVKERARIEIYALIMHELSHLLGTTEAEAQEYQNDVAFAFSSHTGDAVDGGKFVEAAFNAMEALEYKVLKVSREFDKLSDDELDKAFDDVLLPFNAASSTAYAIPFSIYSREEADLFDLHDYQATAIRWSIEALLPDESIGKMRLNEVFGDQDEITLREFQERHFGSVLNESIYDRHKIRRFKTRAELKPAIEELLQFTFEAMARLYQFRFGNPPNKLRALPHEAGPWAHFKGRYHVVESNCSDGRASSTTGYEIVERSPTDLHLIQYSANGHSDTGGLYDGASVMNASSHVTASGGSDWAQRLSERGDLWSPHGGISSWQQNSLRIERRADGEYQMIEKNKWRQFRYTEPDQDSEATCVHQLRKES